MSLAAFSIRRPVTVLMIFVCLVVIGVIAAALLPLELNPDYSFPAVFIDIPYPNSSPEEIESQITRPSEEVLATISGVNRMTSDSHDDRAAIFLEFDWGTNSNVKAIEAREKLDSIRDQLPDDVEHIYVSQYSTSESAVLQLRISGNRDLSNAYDMLDRHLKRRLERLEGVSRVDLYGVEKREVRIKLLSDRVNAHQVDLDRLSQTLRKCNFMVTAGKIGDGNRRFTVYPVGEIKNIDEIGNLVVGNHHLRLRDIADIGYQAPGVNYRRHLNRQYAIGLEIFKEAGANTVDVCRRVKKEIAEIGQDPKMAGIHLYYLEDESEGIVGSLTELLKSGLLGGVLAIIVLFVFLRQWASTLIVALSVPFSIVVTLTFMFFLGISLNILSMCGLLIAVGMLVDNSVVVTENIYRHQQQKTDTRLAAADGVKEVGLAIMAGTATTAIVFLPSIVSSGSEISFYIKQCAVPFTIAIVVSLIISQTIVPLLTSRIRPTSGTGKRKRNRKNRAWSELFLPGYRRVLNWLLHHPGISAVVSLLLIASVWIPIQFVRSDMFPPQQDRKISLYYNLNDTYTLEIVESVVNRVEDYLFANRDKFEIDSVYTYFSDRAARSTIILKKGEGSSRSQEKIRDEIEAGLPPLTQANPSFGRRRTGGGHSLRVQLVGPSTERLIVLSHRLAQALEKIPGFRSVRSEASAGEKEVIVAVDRERARKYGISPQAVAKNIAVAVRGLKFCRLRGENGEVEVWLEYQEEDKKSLEQLANLTLFRGAEPSIKMSSVADFEVRRGPAVIHRENRLTSIGVSIDLKDLTINEAKGEIRRLFSTFDLPAGYAWNYGRSFSFEDETIRTMMLNTLLALVLIYLVMASIFESLAFPGAIWTSIVFAVIGVWWFFFFTGTTFSFTAWCGVLVLIGIVVNNGIVLIDRINQLRGGGLSRHEAILQAGADRLRPIVMTAFTTIFGLIPLCFSTTQIVGGGGFLYSPMARAIVGGLIFSTVVTLFVLPFIYRLLDDLRNWSRLVVRTAISK
jgi:HAE1 family hydrophobic/amphiphilic exporter-1